MFCPNCGTDMEAGQRYCRACGLSVAKVAGLISEQLPAGALERASPEDVARLLRRKRNVERLLVGICLTAGGVFVASIMATIIIKLIINKGEWLEGGIFLGLIVALVAALALVFYRESLKESLTARGVSEEKAKQLTDAPTTSRLLPETDFEPVASVTDRTTELLAVERKRITKEV